jgi:hypothetical protein
LAGKIFSSLRMPPPAIPLYSFDYKGKSRLVGVSEARSGQFYAQLEVSRRGMPQCDLEEFGAVVYGPPRNSSAVAKEDYNILMQGLKSGTASFRRSIAKLGSLGGTRSHPNPSVVPLLSSKPNIELDFGSSGQLKVNGTRRKHVSVIHLPDTTPIVLIERTIDLLVDILSSVVDSQLGIFPSHSDLEDLLHFGLSREKTPCPITSDLSRDFIQPMITLFLASNPWKSYLRTADESTDDREVISGFLAQLYDKARQADIFGEKKQMKRIKREVRERKKFHHTVFVGNLPKDISDESLFAVFDKVDNDSGGKVVYKVFIPRDPVTGHNKGFGFVTCRSAKATNAVLDRTWKLGPIKLHVSKRDN